MSEFTVDRKVATDNEDVSGRFRRSGSGRARRAVWAVADQAVSSLTNFLLAVAVAKTVGVVEFGTFSLAFAVYSICLIIARALATAALTIRYSARGTEAWRNATAAATGSAVTVGAAAGVILVGVGTVFGGEPGAVLKVLGVGLIPLLLQDAWRYALFAAGRARAAFVNDVVWLVGLGVSIGLLAIATTGPPLEALVAAWIAGAGAGALFGMFQCRLVPRPDRTLAWWREHRDIVTNLAMEGVLVSGGLYLTLVGVTVVAGFAATGALRAGQVLVNVLHVPMYGMSLFAVPEAVRLVQRSRDAVLRFCALLGAGLALLALAWSAALLAIPAEAGRALLGETWISASDVILPLSIFTAAVGVQLGAMIGLRAFAMTRRSLYARLVTSVLMGAGGLVGAGIGDAVGAAWGIAAGVILGTIVWWHQLLRPADAVPGLRDHP